MPVKSRDSDSDSEDDAQMRQFLEAADTTLLTNAMYQSQPKEEAHEVANEEQPVATRKDEAQPVKSERYVEDQDAPASDLQISQEMQTHIWRRLSGIIQEQIEFSLDVPNGVGKQKPPPDKVKLVSNADCYLIADLVVEGPAGPKKKPNIRRRTPKKTNPRPKLWTLWWSLATPYWKAGTCWRGPRKRRATTKCSSTEPAIRMQPNLWPLNPPTSSPSGGDKTTGTSRGLAKR